MDYKKKIENTGFLKIDLPEKFAKFSNKEDWKTTNDFKGLSYQARKNFNKSIINKTDHYNIGNKSALNTEEKELVKKYYYRSRKRKRNLGINIFNYPDKLFDNINDSEMWECIMLYVSDKNSKEELAAGFTASKATAYTAGFVVGLNYRINSDTAFTGNALFNVIKRGKQLGFRNYFRFFSCF